jgi:hypothetical protein
VVLCRGSLRVGSERVRGRSPSVMAVPVAGGDSGCACADSAGCGGEELPMSSGGVSARGHIAILNSLTPHTTEGSLTRGDRARGLTRARCQRRAAPLLAGPVREAHARGSQSGGVACLAGHLGRLSVSLLSAIAHEGGLFLFSFLSSK